jgi:hypothetical protein
MRFPSLAARASLLSVAAAGMFLASCTVTRIGNNIALPVVNLSPTSASVQAGASVQFTATVVTSYSTPINWAVNNIQGGNSILGTISQTGLYTAPATVPTPATVTVEAIAYTETYPYGAANVTITPPPTSALLSVAPANSFTPVRTSVQFSATANGATDNSVTWSVNGVAGGNSTVGTISSAGLYTAPTALPSPISVAVTATDSTLSNPTASTTLTLTNSNTAPLYVNFGPNGSTGNSATTRFNGLYTTITICLQGTIQCQMVPNVLVDTGSVGLRLLNSALTTVPATALETVQDSAGDQVEECLQFSDGSYAWGPVLVADVVIAGEKASTVPLQVIGDVTYTVPSGLCMTRAPGANLSSAQTLGANGILGIGISTLGGGTTVQDCGLNCAAGQKFPGYPYYVCPNYLCEQAPVPVVWQVSNPVAFFPQDNNGVEIALPAISSAGAPSLPYTNSAGGGLIPAGSLIFGVGTESNNSLGNATLFPLDTNGHFPKVVFNNTPYVSGGYLASRLSALEVSDAATLGIANCTDNSYYCPGATLPVSLTVCAANAASSAGLPCGANVAYENLSLSIANADQLFQNNPTYSAFNELGAASAMNPANDAFDLGLPFFFGRSVFVGIAGTAVPKNASAPNGYFAF